MQVGCISEHETPPDYHARRYRVPPRGTRTLLGGLFSPGVSFAPGNITKTLPLVRDIGRYNEVDCQAMAEVLAWLRAYR